MMRYFHCIHTHLRVKPGKQLFFAVAIFNAILDSSLKGYEQQLICGIAFYARIAKVRVRSNFKKIMVA